MKRLKYPKKLTARQQLIRDVLMDCHAVYRLYTNHETANPDVITPNELMEMVHKMDSVFKELKVNHGK